MSSNGVGEGAAGSCGEEKLRVDGSMDASCFVLHQVAGRLPTPLDLSGQR